MHRKKIGLAGKSGSGKNVIADMLCAKHGFKQIAVADGIREECADFLHDCLASAPMNTYLTNRYSESYYDKVHDDLIEFFQSTIWQKPTPHGIRVLLQWWGTEFRRSQDPDYWIKQLAVRLGNDDKIVVSDVRLPDEVKTIRAMGGEVWLVVRDGIQNVGIKGHATEHGLDDAEFDRTITNNGTIDDLYAEVDKLMLT